MCALQTPGLNIITEYIMGYLYPGRPVANMCFKVYGYISMTQALTFLQDFKLGHYMKIPPRTMFMAQVGLIFNRLASSFIREEVIYFHYPDRNSDDQHVSRTTQRVQVTCRPLTFILCYILPFVSHNSRKI